MSDCRICAASNDGAHVLKLEGDVRLTMCTALDQYFQSMFAEPGFVSVWVDVTEADGLDSTTLGMLAQLAIQTRERFAFRPAILARTPVSTDCSTPWDLISSLSAGTSAATPTRRLRRYRQWPARRAK